MKLFFMLLFTVVCLPVVAQENLLQFLNAPKKDDYLTIDLGKMDTARQTVVFSFKNISSYTVMYVKVADCWNDTQQFFFHESDVAWLKPGDTGRLTCNMNMRNKYHWNLSTDHFTVKAMPAVGQKEEIKQLFRLRITGTVKRESE
jgi:hypothetical protein